MTERSLRYGYTTGACAAAAAKGAATMLRDQQLIDKVVVILPGGEAVIFRLYGQKFSPVEASCFVAKDAGDDPDVTHGIEVHASVSIEGAAPGRKPQLMIEGGTGIGRVTKPGLAVGVGEWAINPVPRLMIRHAVNEVLAVNEAPQIRRVIISIPNGEEVARRTLNSRLGIVGGLSILGTTGIVKPISVSAWTDTIDTAIDVGLASGASAIVFSTGRTSELAAQRHPVVATPLPEEAFVMMGDHVGHALRAADRKGVGSLVLAAQFGKLLKVACRHEQTHVASSQLDLGTLASWAASELRLPGLAQRIADSNTAREVLECSEQNIDLIALVCRKARLFALELAPRAIIQTVLVGYDGTVYRLG